MKKNNIKQLKEIVSNEIFFDYFFRLSSGQHKSQDLQSLFLSGIVFCYNNNN